MSIDSEKNPQKKNQKRLYAYSMRSFQLICLHFLQTKSTETISPNRRTGKISVISSYVNIGDSAVRLLDVDKKQALN